MIKKKDFLWIFRWQGCILENADEVLHELMTLF
jgi:hypothetical protein